MRKAQQLFENFIVGFLFLFILASAIFLFIGEGINIDLFNRTIYSEQVSGLDYLYIDTFTDGDINNLNDSAYTFQDLTELNVSFSVTRTFLPPSSDIIIPVIFFVKWKYCPTIYIDDCVEMTNNPSASDMISNALKLQTYYYNFTLPGEVYTDCTTNITIGAVINHPVFNETVLDNNFYTFTIPYCFYPPTDASINAACVPLNDDPSTACTNQRYWNDTLIYGGRSC